MFLTWVIVSPSGAPSICVVQAPEVGGEQTGLESDSGDGDKHQDRHHLGDGHHDVREGGGPHALQGQGMHDPQHDRRADDRGHGSAAFELGKEVTQRREQQHQVGHVAHPGRHPVAEGRCEADVVTETGPGIAVNTAVDVRLTRGQRLEYEGQHEHADAGDQPPDQEWAGSGAAGHLGRQGKNAASDHGPDDDRCQGGQAQATFTPLGRGLAGFGMTVSDIVVSQREWCTVANASRP